MSDSTIQVHQLGQGTVTLGEDGLHALRSHLQGRVLLPDDPGWDEATLIWNGMVARTPALVVQPTSARDVANVIRFAGDRGLLVSVKGGGHNIAGTCIAPDGLTLDMSRMRDVSVDPAVRLTHVGPGCVLGDVDEETQRHGLATVLGFVSETGVAGLTLGGGWGYLTRRFGWTVDNLEEVEIVTADGKVRVANRERHDDLFWAVRGGSGNFGVVTRFTFRLHEAGPTVTGGLTLWSAERAGEVLEAYRTITESAPRELTLAAVVRFAPPAPFIPEEWHGNPVVGMLACYSGDEPDAALAPIRRLADPIASTLQEMPYTALQSMLDAMQPKGPHRYWKTEFLPGLSDGFLDAFREGAMGMSSPASQSLVFHLGGALNERPEDDGAVGNRDARYISGFDATWPPGTPSDPHLAWVHESWERIRPYSTGGNYVNFQLAEDDEERLRNAYRTNFERLRRVKAEYDPDNFFRVNRNISPAD